MIYVEKARVFALKKGLGHYLVRSNKLIYYTNYPTSDGLPRYSQKVTVDLDTGKEISREHLKRFTSNGNYNLCR